MSCKLWFQCQFSFKSLVVLIRLFSHVYYLITSLWPEWRFICWFRSLAYWIEWNSCIFSLGVSPVHKQLYGLAFLSLHNLFGSLVSFYGLWLVSWCFSFSVFLCTFAVFLCPGLSSGKTERGKKAMDIGLTLLKPSFYEQKWKFFSLEGLAFMCFSAQTMDMRKWWNERENDGRISVPTLCVC